MWLFIVCVCLFDVCGLIFVVWIFGVFVYLGVCWALLLFVVVCFSLWFVGLRIWLNLIV